MKLKDIKGVKNTNLKVIFKHDDYNYTRMFNIDDCEFPEIILELDVIHYEYLTYFKTILAVVLLDDFILMFYRLTRFKDQVILDHMINYLIKKDY